MDSDEVRRQLRELLQHGFGRVAHHEQFELVVGDAPADVAGRVAKVEVLVADDLRRGRHQLGVGHGRSPLDKATGRAGIAAVMRGVGHGGPFGGVAAVRPRAGRRQ